MVMRETHLKAIPNVSKQKKENRKNVWQLYGVEIFNCIFPEIKKGLQFQNIRVKYLIYFIGYDTA